MTKHNLSDQDNNSDLLSNPEKLNTAYRHLKLALSAYNLGYYELDLGTGLIECSPIFKANYGFGPDAVLTSADVFKIILPQYREDFERQLDKAISDGQEYQIEYQVQWPDGTVHWIKATASVIVDENKAPLKVVGVTVDVTDVKKTEEKQSMLAAIIDTSDDTILSKTLNGIITSWNKAAEKMFGYSANEVIGKHISILIPPERLHEEEIILSNIAAGKRIDHFVTERLRKDGSIVPISLSVSPIKDSQGRVIGASKIARDITIQKLAQERQSMLAALVDASDDTIISKTLDGTIISWNEAAERMFGFNEAEAIGRNISLITPPSRLTEEYDLLKRVAQGEKVNHFETIRQAKNGQQVPISLSVSPIHDSNGEIAGCSQIARNLTEKKESEQRKAILAAIVDTSEDAIVSKTLAGIITSWNKGAERIFGYSEDEVLGKHISLIIPEERLAEEEHIIGNISKGNRVDHFETRRIAKGNIEVPVSLSVSPIMDSAGYVVGASKIARNISEELRDKEILKRQNENLQILNSIGRSISQDLDINVILQNVTDATTKLTGANFGAFFYNTVGPQGEAFMLYTLSGAPREAFEKFGMPRNTAVFNRTFSGEGILRVDDITKDPRYGKNSPHKGMPEGHLPVVSYLAVPVISSSGSVIGGLFFGHKEAGKFTKEHENLVTGVASQAAIAIDNAKLYLEVQELNNKKDEFIGLASHELKTPLTSISGYLQLLERNQTSPVNKSFVAKTVEQVKKLNSLVSDLLDVSRIESGKLQLTKTTFSAKGLILDVIELINFTQSQHQILFDFDMTDVNFSADRQRIEQALINLLTNAIKYSPDADKVILTLKDQADAVSICIQDFGIGIDKKKQQHIFSRFYRVEDLSPHMSGLGLGLFLTKEIIERHHGQLLVESEPGKGSLFTIILPK